MKGYAGLRAARRRGARFPAWLELAIGSVANFFDAFGRGSFPPTTSLFKLFRLVPDQEIPGTLNVDGTLPAGVTL